MIDGFAEDPVQAVSIANSLSESNPALIPLESVLLSLGEKIHSVRKNLDLSQSELSKKSGLARTFISAVEQGKQNVSLGSLKSISDSLGVPLATLLKDRYGYRMFLRRYHFFVRFVRNSFCVQLKKI